VGRSAGFDNESWDGRSVGRRETQSAGLMPVCERAGREMVLVCWFRGKEKGGRIFGGNGFCGGNGLGLLVSRERERGENFWGEIVFLPLTRDFGFKFFLIKCHCHVGIRLMKDGQEAPL
jgi:hypothetical protein